MTTTSTAGTLSCGCRRLDQTRREHRRGGAITPSTQQTGRYGQRVRHAAIRLLPPVVADALRTARDLRAGRGKPEWEYRPGGWPESDPTIRGWDADSVAETQLARWPAFIRSVDAVGPLGLSNEAADPAEHDYGTHNTIMSFGYVLGRAADGRARLSMLDWGGGIGHYAVYARALMPDVDLDYHCRDLLRLARAGRQVLPEATFHETDASAFARSYDLVLASSSLHYAKDWRGTLASLASVTGRYLYVTRQPFVTTAASFVVIQRPYRHGYRTEYPGWFLNRHEFLEEAGRLGLELLREFLIAERPVVPGAPEQADYRGFLFSVSTASVTA